MADNTCIHVSGFKSFVILLLVGIAGCKGKTNGNGEKEKMSPATQAMSYLSQGLYDEAEISFTKAIQLSPGDIGNYIGLSQLYLLQKDYVATQKQVAAGLKIQPGNLDLQLIQAEIYIQKQEKEKAILQLQEILIKDSSNVRANYKLSQLYPAGESLIWRESYLLKVIRKAPANIVPRLELASILAEGGKADSARFLLESIRKMSPDFSSTAADPYLKAISLLHGDKTSEALPFIRQFHSLMKLTALYAYGLNEIDVPGLIAGYPAFTTSRYIGISTNSNGLKKDNLLADMQFADVSDSAGLITEKILNAQNSVLAIANYDIAGNIYVYTSFLLPGETSSRYYFFSSNMGGFSQDKLIEGLGHTGQDVAASFADYDNDGYQDLFVVTTKGTLVFKNGGDGHFSRVTKNTGLGNLSEANKLLFADFDQDGDLDLYVAANSGNKFFRNNGDETFTDNAGVAGLTATPGTNIDFGDWDSDGDLDIVSVNANGALQVLNNDRRSRFTDIGDSLTNKQKYAGTAVAFGDYNNDGRLDIFVAGGPDGKCSLLKNTEEHGFVPDRVSSVFENSLKGVAVHDAVFFDFDNDGHQDLLIAGESNNNAVRGVQLFHNDSTKGFSNVDYLLPANALSGHHIAIADYNLDGDEDAFLSGPGGIRLLRNDGGNMNGFLQVQLVGLSYGNSKNNRLGIGAQIELKAGNLYQLKTVTRPLMQFGVGSRDSLDAIRIIWPNGVPQIFPDPSFSERTLEQEKLKGSCPFLFTWNGNEFEFIKDMMWRSAMGMPLTFKGKDTTYSFGDASKEYLLIPGEKLQPKDGKYTIKITEELWEAVYFDKAELAAIDHPDSVSTYVDERFVAPPFPGRKIYQVARKYLPVSATDGKGNNLLPKIKMVGRVILLFL
ncbi:MAG: FG-GAP-like repeat-containing protein, partial [Ferruginibacter sp.]